MTSSRLTPEEIERIRELHADGKGRNEIARALGRSFRTISLHCEKLGLTFDRTATMAATKARQADFAVRRQEMADDLLNDANRFLEQVWSPYSQVVFVGRDGRREEEQLDEPPPKEKLDLMRSFSIAIDKHAKLVEFDREKDEQRLAMADRFLRVMLGGGLSDGDADG